MIKEEVPTYEINNNTILDFDTNDDTHELEKQKWQWKSNAK